MFSRLIPSVFAVKFSQFQTRSESITSSHLSSRSIARRARRDLFLSSILFVFSDSQTVRPKQTNPRVQSARTFAPDNTRAFRSLALSSFLAETHRYSYSSFDSYSAPMQRVLLSRSSSAVKTSSHCATTTNTHRKRTRAPSRRASSSSSSSSSSS